MIQSWLGTCKPLLHTLNCGLDKVVRPRIRLLGSWIPAFQVCGGIGAALAALLGAALAAYQGLSPWMMVAIGLTAVSVLLGLTMVTKVISGEERIVNYHHQAGVLVVTAVLLRLGSYPLLPYLDVVMLGVGLFIACGRIGCLMMGCCHGRPHPWGVRYRQGHVAFGFAPTYVGVRLYPVQAVESLWLFCVVLGGSIAVLRDQPPGIALSWY
ncbi:MAG: prolipoprotein diacylglyceryl transferase, partial [Anaerolineae bacterium]|nr:prolipoprotein diacylglyceryl transferase [Anaerolineae bacterium]